MNAAHIHLMLNHVPLFAVLAVTILLVVAVVRRLGAVARAALVVALLAALVTVLVYVTGEPAEELVEDLPGVSESILEAHEEAALVATMIVGAFGLISLYWLVAFRRRAVGQLARGLFLVASLVPLAALGYTAYLGGQIRHSEIRSVLAVPHAEMAQEELGHDGEDER